MEIVIAIPIKSGCFFYSPLHTCERCNTKEVYIYCDEWQSMKEKFLFEIVSYELSYGAQCLGEGIVLYEMWNRRSTI